MVFQAFLLAPDVRDRLPEGHFAWVVIDAVAHVEVQANTDYEAYRARGVDKRGRRVGRPANPYTPPPAPAGKINTTDPDSRNVKTLCGWVQGSTPRPSPPTARS